MTKQKSPEEMTHEEGTLALALAKAKALAAARKVRDVASGAAPDRWSAAERRARAAHDAAVAEAYRLDQFFGTGDV
jgi:hypothetical protein